MCTVFFLKRCGMIQSMNTLTIKLSREMLREGEVVILPKRQFISLVARAEEAVVEKDVLRWSREAINRLMQQNLGIRKGVGW